MNKSRLEDLFFARSIAIKIENDKVLTGIYSKDFDELIAKIMKEIKEDYPEYFEGSSVQCDLCNHQWVAVRPAGLQKLECPKCHNLTQFENI